MDALVTGSRLAVAASTPEGDQLRAGDRVADARTLRETGTVIDATADTAAVVWDRSANGWHTYSADTLKLVSRLDGQAARRELERATAVAHSDA